MLIDKDYRGRERYLADYGIYDKVVIRLGNDTLVGEVLHIKWVEVDHEFRYNITFGDGTGGGWVQARDIVTKVNRR
jgi:hypothetical protein